MGLRDLGWQPAENVVVLLAFGLLAVVVALGADDWSRFPRTRVSAGAGLGAGGHLGGPAGAEPTPSWAGPRWWGLYRGGPGRPFPELRPRRGRGG